MDTSTIEAGLSNRSWLDFVLMLMHSNPPETEPESAPAAPVDEVMLTALFGNDMPPPDSSRAAGKLPCSDRTSDDVKAHRLKNKEC